jgi:hypothetical protein
LKQKVRGWYNGMVLIIEYYQMEMCCGG